MMRGLASVLVLLAACEPTSDAPRAPVFDPGSAALDHETVRRCPVTLPGVTATVEDVRGGVRWVLAAEPQILLELRARSRKLARKGGGFRRCPIVLDDTVLAVEDIAGGVAITVTANDPVALRETSRARLALASR